MADLENIDSLKATALTQAKEFAERVTGLKGNTALAKLLTDGSAKSVTPQAISQWGEAPIGRVFDIERATGVPRHKLRPDFFEAPARETAA